MIKIENIWLPRLALCVLIFHTSLAAIIMRRSREGISSDSLYCPAASVFFGEILKIAISIYLHDAFNNQKQTLDGAEKGQIHIEKSQVNCWNRLRLNALDIYDNASWKMSIPALLYVVQNCLQINSISIITAIEYQALSQLKIIAIGVFSMVLLKKRLFISHWINIATLLLGVILIQSSKALPNISFFSFSPGTLTLAVEQILEFKQRFPTIVRASGTFVHLTGTLSAVTACIFGSYAGVYMEKVFKSSRKGLWSSNAELSFFSLFPASILMLLHMYHVESWNVFRNFGIWAWATVLTRGLGGVVVALVLKYCDNILKAFATSMAIVLSMLIDTIWSEKPFNSISIFGAIVVVCSSVSYANIDSRIKNSVLHNK